MKTIIAIIITAACSQTLADDPLPSWNDTVTKESIVAGSFQLNDFELLD